MKRSSAHVLATFTGRSHIALHCGTGTRRAIHVVSTFVALFSATVSFGQEKKLEPMRGVDRGQPQPSLPILLISINDSVGSIAEPGWPLVVFATRASDDKSATVPL